LHRENVFGKASRSRFEDMLRIFRRRYLSEPAVTKALVTLVRKKFPTAALDRLLYFHSARADQLLHDAVTEILVPMQARGLTDVNVSDFERQMAEWVHQAKTSSHWSEWGTWKTTMNGMPEPNFSITRVTSRPVASSRRMRLTSWCGKLPSLI